MGLYELSGGRSPSGHPMWVNHSTGDATKPKAYLYRGDGRTHDGKRDGLWMVMDEEDQVAANTGWIRSVEADAALPTEPGLNWIQADGLIVTEVGCLCEGSPRRHQ